MNRQRNYEVAQVLGRKIEVDTEGRIHVFWKEGEDEIEHIFDDIAPAIRQEKHVLEGWLGIEETIRGQVLVIPGEVEILDALVKKTMNLAREFLTSHLLSPQKKEELRRRIADLITQISAVRNAHKVKMRRELEFAHLQTSADILFGVEKKATESQTAGGLYEAAEAGLARLEDIARKVWGVGIRLQILTREEERVKKVIRGTYTSLHRIIVKLQGDGNLTQKDLMRIANQVCGGKANLVNGLESIWVPPYGFRVRSREVQRLKKISNYAIAGDKNSMLRALLSAYKKLRPVIKEEQNQRLPKRKRWIPR